MKNTNENIEKTEKGMKKQAKYILITLSSVVVLFFSIKYVVRSVTYENTDNAQIDGNIIPLRAKIGGHAEEVRFTDNQQVKKGDTLVILEVADLQAQVKQAEARLESAMLAVQTSSTGIQSATFTTQAAQENIAAAKARLWQVENDFARVENMYKQEATTLQTYDAAKTALEMAQAQYKALTAQKETVGSQVTIQNFQTKTAEARVKEAEALLVLAQNQLDNAYIIAPCNGIISKKNVEEGQLMIPGVAMAAIINLDHLWVTANFKETQLNKIQQGQQAKISVDAYPRISLNGTIESLAGATGPKFSLLPPDNATGNFVKVTQRVPVRIAINEIDNEEHKMLVPGMNVIVDVKIK